MAKKYSKNMSDVSRRGPGYRTSKYFRKKVFGAKKHVTRTAHSELKQKDKIR
jgi:hypothetical protein